MNEYFVDYYIFHPYGIVKKDATMSTNDKDLLGTFYKLLYFGVQFEGFDKPVTIVIEQINLI